MECCPDLPSALVNVLPTLKRLNHLLPLLSASVFEIILISTLDVEMLNSGYVISEVNTFKDVCVCVCVCRFYFMINFFMMLLCNLLKWYI